MTNGKGKLIKVSSSVSTTEYTAFDVLGRVTGHKQITDSTNYTTAYSYNLSSALIEETYPSGRKVKNTLDATGDLSLVETQPSGGSWSTRANNLTYTAAGAVSGLQLGNGRWESTQFNARFQPTLIALGTTQNGSELLRLEYSYGTTANNGNLLSQTITVPGLTYPFVQSYTYDPLNRLASATETNNSTQIWTQAFGYDRYGNRNITSGTGQTSLTFDSTNNRIITSGYSYDNSGNTTSDPSGKSFVYDGENKQTSVSDGSGTLGTYYYDGEGKRIKKTSGSDNVIFLYDATGKLIEERNASSGELQTSYVYAGSRLISTETSSGINYLTNDHLNSPRINTDTSGGVTSRHDYHPFGEEIATSQRTPGLSYSGDIVRKQFTGYERDNETDLSYAQARYYSKTVGRFSSPDPPFVDQFQDNPQSWNLYIYVRNNPLSLIDPFGTKAAAGCPPDAPKGCYERDGKYYVKGDDGKEMEWVGVLKVDTALFTGRRPGRFSFFDRWAWNFGRWLRDRFAPNRSPNRSTPAAPTQYGGGNRSSQPNQVYGPPNPRYSLPSASQRLDNMHGLSRSQAQVQLQSQGFSLASTTASGNQRWEHRDGSRIWVMNNGTVGRLPSTAAAQAFGASGKHGGVRVDAGSGQIMWSHQHHRSGTPEVVH